MQRQGGKPLYWENHEAFRRLPLVSSISVVIGVFFGDKVASGELPQAVFHLPRELAG